MENKRPQRKETYGELMRRRRGEIGMTQERLAELTGIAQSEISRMEHGFYHRPPQTGRLVAISKALKIDADEMILLAGSVPPNVRSVLSKDKLAKRCIDTIPKMSRTERRRLMALLMEVQD